MLPENPVSLAQRQKAELAALRKTQAAERRILNALAELEWADARRIVARVMVAYGWSKGVEPSAPDMDLGRPA